MCGADDYHRNFGSIVIVQQVCVICYKSRPDDGWFRIDDGGDEGREFFCSETCYDETQPEWAK